jgi:hypothetical protein
MFVPFAQQDAAITLKGGQPRWRVTMRMFTTQHDRPFRLILRWKRIAFDQY